MQHDDLKFVVFLLLEEALEAAYYFVVSYKQASFASKSLFMQREDVAEKTLVHKTAVKRISTH